MGGYAPPMEAQWRRSPSSRNGNGLRSSRSCRTPAAIAAGVRAVSCATSECAASVSVSWRCPVRFRASSNRAGEHRPEAGARAPAAGLVEDQAAGGHRVRLDAGTEENFMAVSDPIADFLTAIRNAVRAKHRKLDVPASQLKTEIAKLLLRERFINNFKLM